MSPGAVTHGVHIVSPTGTDLSKILGGQTQIWGEMWQKLINAWELLNFFGARARATPQNLVSHLHGTSPYKIFVSKVYRTNSVTSTSYFLCIAKNVSAIELT